LGGNEASEAAVTTGLRWLARHQTKDGSWKLDDLSFKDKGMANDIAGTALGLLPFLAAGHTHKSAKEDDYAKVVEKALQFLIRQQDKKTGKWGKDPGMYGQALATIAVCEAYGLTRDSALTRPAQLAVNYTVKAQHDQGGWRYTPGQA